MGQISWHWRTGCLVTALVVASPASTQTREYIDQCVNNPKRFSAELAIGACNEAIQSGRWAGKELAWAIYNRGNAYLDQKNYCRAIVDYNEAIRLRPQHAHSYRGRGLAYRGISDFEQATA